MKPALWRHPPRLQDLPRDALAGLVVAAVALPLGLAFAIASGAPPEAGLVTVVVAGGIAALLAGSRFQVTGPTGAFVVVLAAVVAEHGFANLLLAVFMAGVLLLLAGLFRLGRLIRFIPYPVTTGFTAGIAVVIFIGQLPDLTGIFLGEASPEPLVRLIQTLRHVVELDVWAIAVAGGTVLTIVLVKRFAPRVPGPFVALVAGTVLAAGFGWPVATVGDRFTIAAGIPAPSFPDWTWQSVRTMLPSAFTIALLGAIESLLSAVVADGMTRTRHDPDQELVAQGVANMASPLFGGLAATGAIARTATNVQNHARTPLASLIHAGVVLAVLLVAAPYAMLVPMPILAGILAVVAWNMSERHRFARILRMPRGDAAVLLVTFGLTIAVDLTAAVVFGLLLAMLLFMKRMAETTRIGELDPTTEPPELPRIPEGVVVYSVDGPFFFGAAERFQSTMERLGPPPKALVLRLRDVHYLDATGFAALERVVETVQGAGCRVMIAGIQTQPLEFLENVGAVHLIGEENLFRSTAEALDALRAAARPD